VKQVSVGRILWFVVAIAMVAIGALLGILGLFALVYNGDGGDTYVTFRGDRVSADLVGAIALGLGVVFVVASVALFKHPWQGRFEGLRG